MGPKAEVSVWSRAWEVAKVVLIPLAVAQGAILIGHEIGVDRNKRSIERLEERARDDQKLRDVIAELRTTVAVLSTKVDALTRER